jgi:transposase-like protein
VSCDGIPFSNSKKVANHSRFDSPNSAISSQLSAPQIVPQTAITNISLVVAQEREKSYTLFMVKLKCYHCQSENLVRNGKTNNGKQRYLCNDCGKMSRDNPQSNSYSAEEREQILRAYEERSSLRGLTRTFGVARNTVSGWLREKNS